MNTSAVSPFTLTKEQYQELYQEVLLFAEIGGVVNDEEGIWKMCEEEFVNELLPAIEAEDRIKIIDGVCDSWVTIVQLHHHYMSRPTWELPEPETTYLHDLYEICEMIQCRYAGYVHNSLRQLLSVSEKLAKEYNFNLHKAIKEVNRSNMTKFVPIKEFLERNGWDSYYLEEAAKQCEELSKGKYKNVKAETVTHYKDKWDTQGQSLIVFRENFGDGKICKNLAFYEEPDFEGCWL